MSLALKHILEVLFPRYCVGCGLRVLDEEGYVCWDCLSRVQFITEPFCRVCGTPVGGKIDVDYVCSTCTKEKTWYDAARAAAKYEEPLRSLIHQFKYQHGIHLAPQLADLLYASAQTHLYLEQVDLWVPVPLHSRRKKARGYNQCEMLAYELAKKYNVGKVKNVLKRVRNTPAQARLGIEDRKSNVKNAFRLIPEKLDGEKIVLIDDVFTTGATVRECAKMLKKNGAKSVTVLTLAKG